MARGGQVLVWEHARTRHHRQRTVIKDDDRTVLKSVLLESRMPVMNLTETRIRDIQPGSGIWRDEQVRGLMVVSHKTTKTYAVQVDVRRNGRHVRTVRVKVDRGELIGLREARRLTREIMSQIQSGID